MLTLIEGSVCLTLIVRLHSCEPDHNYTPQRGYVLCLTGSIEAAESQGDNQEEGPLISSSHISLFLLFEGIISQADCI